MENEYNLGLNNPNYKHGKYCKDSYNYCVDCNKLLSRPDAKRCRKCMGKNHSKERIGENASAFKDGRCLKEYYCQECNIKIGIESALYKNSLCPSCAKKGKRNPSYIHGEGYNKYTADFSDELKMKIRDRDNHECQNCHIIEEEYLIIRGRFLDVHHIDYDRTNCKENNLITLCNQCNLRANFNVDYWYAYFMEIMEELYSCQKLKKN